jgi:mannose-6-phosphate isomerase-like protein (cupin superfamily)
MKELEVKSFSTPDEVRTFDKGKLELIKVGGAMIGRATFQPGWKWSESIKPIAKTESCQAPHFQYQVSGTLRVKMDDGTERDVKAGEIALIPPGHDGWVVGNEPVVMVDFQGYAKEEGKK